MPRILPIVCLLLVSPCLAGPNTECPQLPTDVPIFPGEEVRFGDRTFKVAAYLERGSLHLSLFARAMDPVTREPRAGTFVPHLQADYRLRRSDGTALAAGGLSFEHTGEGPAYTASVPLPGEPGPMALDLDLAEGSPEASPDHGGEHGECPSIPANLQVLIDLPGYGEEPGGGGGPVTDTGGLRMSVLAALDVRAADNYSNIWGWNDGTRYLAIIGCTSGTVFIDVTDPAGAHEVGFVAGPSSSWREIKSYGDYAYIVTEGSGTGQGLQIVDLRPATPTLVNTYSSTFQTAHTLFIDEPRGHAYINGANTGMRVLDLADPVNPVEIGAWNVRYVHDSYVRDGIACFAEINNGLQELLDVSNPASPQILSTWATPGNFTHNCWANDDYSLLVTTDENSPGGYLAVYDVTAKTTPGVLLAGYRPSTTAVVHNAYWEDGDRERVALSHYGIGARLIDLHRPTAPLELGSYDTYPSGDGGYNGAWGMYNYDPRGYLYVSDIQTGFYLLAYEPTGGSLSGVVRDAVSASPVEGAKVVVLADGTTTTSRADGVYAVYAPAGETQVRVTAPGYRSTVARAGSMPLDGRLDADVVLDRLPRVALTGTVRRSDTSTAVAGATVSVAGTSWSTTTAADGTYAFPDVPIGQQTVTVEAFGYAPGEGRIVLADGAAGTLDFALLRGRFVDDAETSQGWSLGVPDDTAVSGRWERVDPNGTGGGTVQPEHDHTPAPGAFAFVTGQSNPGASTETNDVDAGVTTLLSPTFDASGLGAATISFHRWLSTNAGFLAGGRLIVDVSPSNGSNGSWVVLEDTTANANTWTRRTFDLGSVGPLTDGMKLRFRAQGTSSAQWSVLEAAVDDVEVVRACRTRFNAAAGDLDRDGTVDDCDACPADAADDLDADGVCGDVDNAPAIANPTQADGDGDGVGDVADNCGAADNPAQRDLDVDGAGDACDLDLDGDGLANGDDPDRDGDTIADLSDGCPDVPDPLQVDHDGDGAGDLCDMDDGEVQGLRLAGESLRWEPEQGSDGYNLYRGELGASALVRLAACRIADVPGTTTADPDLPVPGDGFFYLVSRVAGGQEGSLGYASSGEPRVVATPCP